MELTGKEKVDIEEAIQTLQRYHDAEYQDFIVQRIRGQHRSKQQHWGRLILKLLVLWAHDFRSGPGHYDLRNEATVCWADEVVRTTMAEGSLHFPFI